MALAYRKEVDEKTILAVWKIEEDAEALYRQLQLKQHEIDYLETLQKGKRNLHWLGTRVLLRKMIDTPFYIDSQTDEHGKPYLTNFPYAISLSHSFDYAAVMISRDKKVGIDIELIKTKIERVAHKFMCSEELEFISTSDKIEHLYACWCAKEAIYKLYGRRNISFLQDIRLHPFDLKQQGAIPASLRLADETLNYLVAYERFNDYMIGYVSK